MVIGVYMASRRDLHLPRSFLFHALHSHMPECNVASVYVSVRRRFKKETCKEKDAGPGLVPVGSFCCMSAVREAICSSARMRLS